MKLMDLINTNIISETPQRKCGMWLNVGIPYMVKLGKWKELEKWEKLEFIKGIKSGKFDKDGNHLKNNNPYQKKINKLNELLRGLH